MPERAAAAKSAYARSTRAADTCTNREDRARDERAILRAHRSASSREAASIAWLLLSANPPLPGPPLQPPSMLPLGVRGPFTLAPLASGDLQTPASW